MLTNSVFSIKSLVGSSTNTALFNVAVNNPVVINAATATIDLSDSLGNPHTPCPLVHPFPNLVPNPTKNPATAAPKYPILEMLLI